MTANRPLASRRSVPADRPQAPAQRPGSLRRGSGRHGGPERLSAGQLTFAFPAPKPRPPADPPKPTPRPPLPDLPAMPKNPTKAVRARVEARRDAILAVCRCPHCPNDFADGDAYWLHRDPRTGRCLDPRQAGLTRQPQPIPCWTHPKETT